MAYSFKDKVVLITGAASGIGAVVVKLLMQEDVKHVAVLDVAEEAGHALKVELNAKYGPNKVEFYKVDVTNEARLIEVFQKVKKDNGYIDLVINNAGIMNDSLQTYKKEIEINVTALVTGTLKALEFMRKDEGGHGGTVINISSIAGLTQSPWLPIYWGTKAAVLQFSNCIGLEDYYQKTGVRVLTICYGGTASALLTPQKLGTFDPYLEELITKLANTIPLQKMESAAQGLIDMYKSGESGSTWVVNADEPVRDITAAVKGAYKLMTDAIKNK